MAIKKYYATKDNTITNAFKANLSTRGVSGNMGQSDVLETFYIFAQANTSSSELARILVQFDSDTISTDRTEGTIPASGSVSFYLRLYNAEHVGTTPKDFTLIASAVSGAWDEGLGLDMEEYSDIDASNWLSSSTAVEWVTAGGDIYDDASSSFSQSFDTGFENLEIDVTPLMEQWISSSANSKVAFNMRERTNDGFRVSWSGSDETGNNSYYNKKFFARGSQFFFKRPTIEARWDSSKKDNRGNFYLSSSLVPASDNLMKLYLYNVVRGQLTNIPGVGTGGLLVSLYSGTLDNTAPSGSKIGLAIGGGTVAALDINTTASYVETGIYSCSFAYTSSAITTIFDVWHSGSTATEYHTGSSIGIDTFDSQNFNFNQRYVSKITNLRANYSTGEVARFRLFTRLKDWNPTIYTVAKNDVDISIVDDVYYKIVRANDDWIAVDFGTGSTNCTRLSYDASGSYFDFDMKMLEANSVYQIYFTYLINGNYVEQPEVFRFRTT